jgi:hypothetical protein
MFFRFLLTVLGVYFLYRVIKRAIPQSPTDKEVRGRPQNKPLDLSDKDVKDAEYKDLDDRGP